MAAVDEIERGRELGQRQGAWQVIVSAMVALADVRRRQHRPTDARRLLTGARNLLDSLPDPGDGHARVSRAERALRLEPSRRGTVEGAPYWELSAREMDVLRLLPSRLTQREMAAELYVSFNTVTTHTRAVFRKLGVSSRSEAVARARVLGLIDG